MVNIEPSLSTQRDISGHIVSGHIDTTATITAIEWPDENNCTVTFAIDPKWMRYIFQKGYLAINGCSLTVGVVDKKVGQFSVYLIPETIRRTTFELLQVGDRSNIEVERQTQVIVDTIWASMEDFREQFAEELRREFAVKLK
jgi:riboflavin synthase